jgi:beta-glucosidase
LIKESLMPEDHILKFPEGFVWGTATSAFQIEGACAEGGRGPSIWDSFCQQPGKIQNGDTASTAADHYHRWEEDVQVMQTLGLNAYRFSIAWPRILPEGKGRVNPQGLDFYDRLVDSLLEHGIQPFITLYHWDLPQTLQEEGGWVNRAIPQYFADYALVAAARLGDRVETWTTLNEPAVSAFSGYFLGSHAPGVQDPFQALQAGHHLLLAHGLAAQALRSVLPAEAQVGITLSLSPVYPASNSDADQAAARRADAILNRLFLDPVLRGCYPQELLELFDPLFSSVDPADLKVISASLDYLGVNYYSRTVVQHGFDIPLVEVTQVFPEGNEYSQMWEIYPQGLFELLSQVWDEYRPAQIFITENGIPVADGLDLDGRVRDHRRVRYLHQHLVQVHRAIEAGIPVRGYFVWSLMDNFEWAYGYTMRFGLVYVDFATQIRILKDSGRWYSQVTRRNGLQAELDPA